MNNTQADPRLRRVLCPWGLVLGLPWEFDAERPQGLSDGFSCCAPCERCADMMSSPFFARTLSRDSCECSYKTLRVTHVAIRFRGVVYALPSPSRHHHVIRKIVDETGADTVDNDEQGFLDESGRFLSREQALTSARLHGQVKDLNDIRAGQLFSEDLW